MIAAPTNYDSQKNFFDCSAVEAVIELVLKANPRAVMIIKSTIPVGYTEKIREKYHTKNILFSPEFLRESKDAYLAAWNKAMSASRKAPRKTHMDVTG